ncbi:MAG: hypothetical protein HWN66_03600 [Candidatus Helarchaeota archaeon]|nr:hypothetical protein [Candidatus Helarchaeota archaeon]
MTEWRGYDVMRIIVVVLVIIIPIYFFLLIYFVNVEGELTLNLGLFQAIGETLTIYVIFPLCFSFTWWIFIYVLRNKISNSYSIIKEETSPIPTRWLIFYGVNAVIMLGFFIIPLVSSIFAIFGFFVLAWNVVVKSDWAFERGKSVLFCYGLIIFGLFLTFPVLIQIEFWNDYTVFWNHLWGQWGNYVPYIYSFSIVVVNALTIGSLLYFIYSGSSEFERGAYGTTYDKTPRRAIILLELILFIIFTLIWLQTFPPNPVEFFSWLYLIISLVCLAIAILIFLIGLIKSRQAGIRPSILGYLYAVLFLGIEGYRIMTVAMNKGIEALFSATEGYPIELITTTILIASIIFIIVFLVAVARAPDERSW